MKFQLFLDFLKECITYKQIDLTTFRTITSNFYACLSPLEQQIYQLDIDLILSNTSKQLSLDTIMDDLKAENLKTELENLKKRD